MGSRRKRWWRRAKERCRGKTVMQLGTVEPRRKKNWLTSRFFRLPIFETFLFVMGFLICLHFPFNSSFFSVTISLWGADKNNKLSRKRRLTKRGIGVKREICFFFRFPIGFDEFRSLRRQETCCASEMALEIGTSVCQVLSAALVCVRVCLCKPTADCCFCFG